MGSAVEEEEQFIRKNSVEITGVPEVSDEDVFQVIEKVGKGLGIEVTQNMLVGCQRFGEKKGPEDKTRSIVVNFAKRKHKEEFLQKRKLRKILTTKDIDLPGNTFIYVNESLSEENRKILNAARDVKRKKGFKYLWVRNGKILLRKEENGNVITLSSLEQVASL
ncbi:uncharacterized protein LOC128995675 [Macrosteles quadrilineatus]|uniref:uncharacterized protein LOC128995675 n=1 Tax=Macrosteles quadrilineatus TaxID=74068 RepID=UPI0023E245FA|nr:uncharacterized protein LOC128995675 [Macrosteles quadrilineatus]